MSDKKNILVYANWKGMADPVQMGYLVASRVKGKEIFSFEYTKNWLQSGFNSTMDPDLQYYSGRFFPRDEKQNFGVFLDSCPDRWGRVLMDRREAVLAKAENRNRKTLFESDYLLGVFDLYRMGALRFKLEAAGNFLNADRRMTIPPWTSLRELEHACKIFEEDNISDKEQLKWINLLLAPGASLGGARPKASVLDQTNNLWIAKFPSIKDEKNVGAWEYVAFSLAKKCGLNIAEGEIKKFSSKSHTFLTKRFDRNEKGQRIHFASAMTMLGQADGTDYTSGVSYLEIAEFLIRNGADTDSDLEELWRRIVFNISIKNTDDHLRNHGFLLTEKGWRLSPAFDLNPNEFGSGLSLNISETDNALDYDLAISVAEYFRVSKVKANKIIRQTKETVSDWRKIVQGLGISKVEQDRMSTAFNQ
jgi:serine/threonine-protein kinase HipA